MTAIQCNLFGEERTLEELDELDRIRELAEHPVKYKPLKCEFCGKKIQHGGTLYFCNEQLYCSEDCLELDNPPDCFELEPGEAGYDEKFEKKAVEG